MVLDTPWLCMECPGQKSQHVPNPSLQAIPFGPPVVGKKSNTSYPLDSLLKYPLGM